LTGEGWLCTPRTVSIGLWRSLTLPPIQRIDGGLPDVQADVVIETEHALWALVVAPDAGHAPDGAHVARLVDAGAWLAGGRELHCGAIVSRGSNTMVAAAVRNGYARSSASVTLRSATRGPAAPSAVSWGAIQWTDLAAVLKECVEAPHLPSIERAL